MISLGLGTTINNRLSSAGFSAEYQAILTAGSAYTQPSSTEQTLQNQLILDLKSAGIWDKLDAFYMFCNGISTDSTGAFARINWKNPTANYGIANPNLPTITAKNGFLGNGSNQGINLQFPANTGTNYKSPNGSYGVKLGTVSSTTSSPIMAALGYSGNINRIRQNNTSSIEGAAFDPKLFATNDFIHLNRKVNTVSTNIEQFVNGVRTQGFGAAWYGDTTSYHILRYGDGASYGDSQIRTAFIGGDLSGLASTFNSILNNYYTNLFATTNYLVNPKNLTTSSWYKDSGVSVTHFNSGGVSNQPYDNYTNAANTSGSRVLQEFNYAPWPTPTATFSVYLRGSGNVRLGIYNNSNNSLASYTLTSSWKQYTVTFNNLTNDYMWAGIYFDSTNVNCDICYSQFEATAIANPIP